jgi:hypothetical protein
MVVTDMGTLRGDLEALISNPELRRSYALNGLRLAHRRHDSKIVTGLLEAALHGVIASQMGAPFALAAEGR